MSDDEDALIEQLRSYGISPEELEGLIRNKEGQAAATEDLSLPTSTPPPQPTASYAPGPFDALTEAEPVPTATPATGNDEPDLLYHAARLDSYRVRDLAVLQAKEAAAEIRSNAVKLVSDKLQAAEDEVMALRLKAADDAAKLRKDTAVAMVARLQDAENEAELLRRAAREESRAFWESTYQEFNGAQQRIADVRGQLVALIDEVSDAVGSVESAAGSIAALSARHLTDLAPEATETS